MSSQRRVCPGCSCLCDGLTASADSLTPLEANNCSRGSQWFASRTANASSLSQAQFDSQVAEIRELLTRSNLALITGIGNLSTQAQQAAVKVADRFCTGIDTGWCNAGRGSMAAFQRFGKVTATFGEIANRSDLIVLWFCDPVVTHPRFIERFVRSSSKPPKRLIVIDEQETETASMADQFLRVETDAIRFVQQLRSEIDDDSKSELAAQLVAAEYGSVMIGKPNDTAADFDVLTDQWFQLVRSLNNHTRFVMGSLRPDRNGIGANNVLTSLCGFPDAVRFTDDGPMHNGLEYSTTSVVRRRECDLLIACDSGANEPFESQLDAKTIAWLKSIPVIVLSDFPANRYQTANVHVATGTPGWTEAGDFVRADDVPIPMSATSGIELRGGEELFEGLL